MGCGKSPESWRYSRRGSRSPGNVNSHQPILGNGDAPGYDLECPFSFSPPKPGARCRAPFGEEGSAMFENLKWWKLTRDLESSKFDLRKTALEEIAASDDERAADLLLSLLANEQHELSLRRLAAEALAKR